MEPFWSDDMTKTTPYYPILGIQKQVTRRKETGDMDWVNEQRLPEFMVGHTNIFYFVEGIYILKKNTHILPLTKFILFTGTWKTMIKFVLHMFNNIQEDYTRQMKQMILYSKEDLSTWNNIPALLPTKVY